MYLLNNEAKERLNQYKLKKVAETIGINPRTLSDMINKNRTCIKLTAYSLSKYLDKDAEIVDYFTRKES